MFGRPENVLEFSCLSLVGVSAFLLLKKSHMYNMAHGLIQIFGKSRKRMGEIKHHSHPKLLLGFGELIHHIPSHQILSQS